MLPEKSLRRPEQHYIFFLMESPVPDNNFDYNSFPGEIFTIKKGSQLGLVGLFQISSTGPCPIAKTATRKLSKKNLKKPCVAASQAIIGTS